MTHQSQNIEEKIVMEGKGNKSSDYYLNVRRQSIALARYLVVA